MKKFMRTTAFLIAFAIGAGAGTVAAVEYIIVPENPLAVMGI